MLTTLDADPSVHVMVITGNEKAFAAGADIAAMANGTTPRSTTTTTSPATGKQQKSLRKPLIAAVSATRWVAAVSLR